jgi:hypothetical protein
MAQPPYPADQAFCDYIVLRHSPRTFASYETGQSIIDWAFDGAIEDLSYRFKKRPSGRVGQDQKSASPSSAKLRILQEIFRFDERPGAGGFIIPADVSLPR